MCDIDLSNETIIHVKNKNQEYLQFKRLLEYKDILTHCYSVGLEKDFRTFRQDKTPLKMEEYVKSIENYKTLLNEVDLDFTKLIKANQAHTDVIKIIDKCEENEKIDTLEPSDGLITNKKNIVLATTNADCILFLFFDPVKKVVANVHSGWKGTLQEISVKTVVKMQEEFRM